MNNYFKIMVLDKSEHQLKKKYLKDSYLTIQKDCVYNAKILIEILFS
jgi:hypothetical protein